MRRGFLQQVAAAACVGVLVTGGLDSPARSVTLASAVRVTDVTPSAGSSGGGKRVTVTGTGFIAVAAVRFGSRYGRAINVVSATTLRVTTPPHTAGTVHVRVVARSGRSLRRRADRYTFRPLVVLDPGHNGANASHPDEINRLVPAGYGRVKACNTTGTETNSGYPEHAFNWDVALRVRKILHRHRVPVLMTRPSDTGVGPCVNIRARIESTNGVAAAIAIHADGAASADHGFHVLEDSRRPVGATRATVAKSSRLSVAVHYALRHRSGLSLPNYYGTNGYVRRDDLAGLNLSTSPTTFLELGNMRNTADARRQRAPAGRQRIAAAIAAGILTYLGR